MRCHCLVQTSYMLHLPLSDLLHTKIVNSYEFNRGALFSQDSMQPSAKLHTQEESIQRDENKNDTWIQTSKKM